MTELKIVRSVRFETFLKILEKSFGPNKSKLSSKSMKKEFNKFCCKIGKTTLKERKSNRKSMLS